MQRSPAARRVASSITLLVSAVLLLLAAASWLYAHHQDARFSHADGVVEAVSEQRGADGILLYAPQYRYRLPSHQIALATGPAVPDANAHAPGETLRLAYNPAQPNRATPANLWDVYAASIVLGVAGVILFDIGFAMAWLGRRRDRHTARTPADRLAEEAADRRTNQRAAKFWGGGRLD